MLEVERPFSQDASLLQTTAARQLAVEREDNTLTIGYNPWRNLNLFAGRKDGTTTAEFTFIGSTSSTTAVSYQYREKGNFIGASYNFAFGARGHLGLSLAYADLPTKVVATYFGTAPGAEFTSGTTTGTSYGFKWTGPLADRIDYNIGYKLSRYKFTDKALTADSGGGIGLSTKQSYKTFSVGISKVF